MDCASLHSHHAQSSLSLNHYQHLLLLFVFVLMTAILTDVRWYLIVVWICISLIISSLDYLFMYLLAIYISSLEKCPFRSSAHFWNWLFDILMLNYINCLYMLDINFLPVVLFANISSLSIGCHLILSIISFAV